MFFEPRKGHELPFNPFKAIVAPRPIGWITSISAAGVVNLAPYSFFNAVGDNPPMVMFASADIKDSITNIEETGEFVCNLTTMALAEQMNQTSGAYDAAINEFEPAGLTAAPSTVVRPPRVAESPAALECKLTELLPIRDLDGNDHDRRMAIGEVVGIYVDDACLVDGHFDMVKAGTIARCGYRDYAHVTELFQMTRPKV